MALRRRMATLAGSVVCAGLAVACTTFSQGPGVGAEEGRAVRIEAVTLDPDGAIVALAFVGAAEFESGNPCTSGYRGEADVSDDGMRLLVRVVEWNPIGHRTEDAPCELVGYPRHLTVELDPPFLGTAVQDLESRVVFPVGPALEDASD